MKPFPHPCEVTAPLQGISIDDFLFGKGCFWCFPFYYDSPSLSEGGPLLIRGQNLFDSLGLVGEDKAETVAMG
jgi:hypothetical protein